MHECRAPASVRYCSVSSAISPAPITSTRLSSNRSKIRPAKSAIATLGMLTRWRWSEVSLATRRATRRADWNRWCISGPGAAEPAGQLVGLFHLAENLGFADDHAVEARGDGEQMAHDLGVFERRRRRRGRRRPARCGSRPGAPAPLRPLEVGSLPLVAV